MPTMVRDMPPPPPEQAGTEPPNEGDHLIPDPPSSTAISGSASGINTSRSGPPASSVATLSSPWEFDDAQRGCSTCHDEFNPINRRHHCRLCGKIYCGHCTNQRALIPPSSIVLVPDAGKKAKQQQQQQQQTYNDNEYDEIHAPPTPHGVSFEPDPDPDRMLTYLDDQEQLLYGKGLEERFLLAREPQRVCRGCYDSLQSLQEALRNSNSNAMRFNHVDPTSPARLWNSPLAFTLGHEVRKAAYTLNNLLPLPRRMPSVIAQPPPLMNNNNNYYDNNENEFGGPTDDVQHCKDECRMLSPQLANLDGVQIPAKLLTEAKGVAVLTVVKGGFGLAGLEFGTGLVVARLGEHWSAPCAIGTAGLSWGALIGAQISDHVFLLMTDAAVELMFSNNGSVQLGVDVGVAVGPVGRALEADFGAAPGNLAPIYTYSLSKGLYAGISLDGKVLMTRHRVNEKFYGRTVTGMELLQGHVPTPPAARPLYDALQRCHVYATGTVPRPSRTNNTSTSSTARQANATIPNYNRHSESAEYGEYNPYPEPSMPPPPNDQHSYAGMSDITSDPGY